MKTNEAAWRGIKQLLRVALAAAVAAVAANAFVPGATPKTVVVAILVAIWEGLSKYVHDNPNLALNGLYPF